MLCWLLGLLPLAFTFFSYLDPNALFGEGTPEKGLVILGGSIGLYISRNLASAIITFIALYKRSADYGVLV